MGKKKKYKSTTNNKILHEIIRVDHAGEYGATKIYDGQIAIFGKNSKIGKLIQHMADQEKEHIETFEKYGISGLWYFQNFFVFFVFFNGRFGPREGFPRLPRTGGINSGRI